MSLQDKKIAIIGAGMTAAACVRKLKSTGARIDVFEKSRGAGGRMATRRITDSITADHGAQYFTAKSDSFRTAVADWEGKNIVAKWDVHDGRDCYIGAPAMNSPVKREMERITLKASAHVTHIKHTNGNWHVFTKDGSNTVYDYVICTVPAPQVGAIIGTSAPATVSALQHVKIAPCWALMLVFDQPIATNKTHWRGDDDTVSWIGRNSSKQGREFSTDSWTVHATPPWSEQHLEEAGGDAAVKLYAAFRRLVAVKDLPEPITCTAHRWRYAQTVTPLGKPFLIDDTHTLYIGGDWCLGSRIENAFESGSAIAEEIVKNC